MAIQTPLYNIVLGSCLNHQLNPNLILAIIHQESKGELFAVRYEYGFYQKYVEKKTKKNIGGYVPPEGRCTFITEKLLRACSIGVMQCMGQVAREQGFAGDSLLELTNPEIAIPIGVKTFRHFLDTKGDVESALLRWNGGGDTSYPTKVLSHMTSGVTDYLRMR
jgi:soluble lytic murein transglycosylase-like protein